MTVAVRTISGRLDDDERQQAVYDGGLLIFKDVGPMSALRSFVEELSRATFEAADPTRAQFALGQDDYRHRAGELRRRFRANARTKPLLRAVLEEIGVTLARSAWDRPYLRVTPHADAHRDSTQTLGFHRDTWASNVYSQTNWWAPIYPITAGRTIAFYPRYWDEPLRNNSADWDLEDVIAGKTTSVTPTPTQQVEVVSELRVVIEPGDLLCFSGAQLHASVPNTTGVARFSIETRTADIADEAARKGAPNLDGEAPHVALRWFRRIDDDHPLAQILAGSRSGRQSCP